MKIELFYKKSALFNRPFSIEIRTISRIISLKCAEFLALTPVYGVRGQAGIAGFVSYCVMCVAYVVSGALRGSF